MKIEIELSKELVNDLKKATGLKKEELLEDLREELPKIISTAYLG